MTAHVDYKSKSEIIEIELRIREGEFSYEKGVLTIKIEVETHKIDEDFEDKIHRYTGPFAFQIIKEMQECNRNMLLLNRVRH